MPQYWIFKTEPSAYSFNQLEREGRTVWDGVSNNLALKHLRAMKTGDLALIYHTGAERAAVGIAEVVSEPYVDPKRGDPRLVVVDVKPVRRLARPVTLAEIKADETFADLGLVRLSRLSVVPATKVHWDRLLELAGS